LAFSLLLSVSLKNQGWQVKIRDKEIREAPHVTILRKGKPWRWDLRERQFMDKTPAPSGVPEQLMERIRESYASLCNEWDKMYPNNPIRGNHGDKES
jgi:hypothetical protein